MKLPISDDDGLKLPISVDVGARPSGLITSGWKPTSWWSRMWQRVTLQPVVVARRKTIDFDNAKMSVEFSYEGCRD